MPGRRNEIGADLITDQIEDAPGGGGFSLQVMADLAANIGCMAQTLKDQATRQQQLWAAVRPIPGIAVPPITTTSGIADYPELLAPRAGLLVGCQDRHRGHVHRRDQSTCTRAAPGSGLDTAVRVLHRRDVCVRLRAAPRAARATADLHRAVSVDRQRHTSLTVIEVAAWALPAYLM